MKISEFIASLEKLPPIADVLIEDLNDLWWELDESLIRLTDEGEVILGSKDNNRVRG